MNNVTTVSIWNNMSTHKSVFTGKHRNWTTRQLFLTLFRMGLIEYSLLLFPTIISSVASTNAGTSPQNFQTFSFNIFSTLV